MEKTILKKVGHRFRELRKQKGLTQEELGEKCGFHFSYIGGVERAEKNISLLNIQKICDALEVEVQELFKYENKKNFTKISEREILLKEINEQLIELKTQDLKKVRLFLKEII